MRELKVSRLLGRGCGGPIAHGLMDSGAGVRLVPANPVYNKVIPKLCTEEQLRTDAVLEERERSCCLISAMPQALIPAECFDFILVSPNTLLHRQN